MISIKRIIVSVSIIVGLFFLVAFTTNPSLEDFDKWGKSERYEAMKESTEVEESVAVFMDGFKCDYVITRDDFTFYSLYRVKDHNHYYRVMGMFRHFFVLNEKLSDQGEI